MKNWGPALRFIGLGTYIGFTIFAGVLLGLWLDGVFHTKPFLLLVGLFLGIVMAFYGAYKMILPILNK